MMAINAIMKDAWRHSLQRIWPLRLENVKSTYQWKNPSTSHVYLTISQLWNNSSANCQAIYKPEPPTLYKPTIYKPTLTATRGWHPWSLGHSSQRPLHGLLDLNFLQLHLKWPAGGNLPMLTLWSLTWWHWKSPAFYIGKPAINGENWWNTSCIRWMFSGYSSLPECANKTSKNLKRHRNTVCKNRKTWLPPKGKICSISLGRLGAGP